MEIPPPPKTRKRLLERDRALEDAIAEAPFDDDRWSVLADWLLEREDPRADIVRAEQGGDRKLIEHAYLRLHPALLGRRHRTLAPRLKRCRWRCGFALTIALTGTDELLGELLATPAMALLREVFLELDPERALEALAEARCARSLRSLHVRANDRFGPTCLDRLRVDSLTVDSKQGTEIAYEPALATLRALELTPRDRATVVSLFGTRGSFPELRELVLWGKSTDTWTARDLAPLLAGDVAPRLERLVFRISSRRRELAQALRVALQHSALRDRAEIST